MIEAKFRFCEERRELEMEAWGHARAGKKGADPVCAGVSALVMALGSAVEAMDGRGILEYKMDAWDGYACISAKVSPENLPEALMVFWTVQMGIGTIAQKYPECVKLDGVLAVQSK